MAMVVRAAADGDVHLIAHLTRACWAGKVTPSSSGHREDAQRVSTHLREGGGFLLFDGDVAAGSVRWLPEHDGSRAWDILRMGVLPAYRGRNLSRLLLEAVIHHALACAVDELRLAVRHDQPRLIDLYAAYGFELANDLAYTHANPSEPAPCVMRRTLLR